MSENPKPLSSCANRFTNGILRKVRAVRPLPTPIHPKDRAVTSSPPSNTVTVDPTSAIAGGFLAAAGQWLFQKLRREPRPNGNGSSSRITNERLAHLEGKLEEYERRLARAGF